MKCVKGHKNHKWIVNPKEPYSLFKICAHCNNKKIFENEIDEWDWDYRNTRKPIGHFNKVLKTPLSDDLNSEVN